MIRIGEKHGLLTAVGFAEHRKNKGDYWFFDCECGKRIVAKAWSVTTGHTKSCGCLHRAIAKVSSKTHGDLSNGKRARLYMIWRSMIDRCGYKGNQYYHRYGGRGICVCNEWMSYSTFKDWALAHGYADNLTIDRRNNDGNYEPNNCKWSTARENSDHTSRTHAITVHGETHCASEWARRIGMRVGLVSLWARTYGAEEAASRVQQCMDGKTVAL